jgi:hypothetical protein
VVVPIVANGKHGSASYFILEPAHSAKQVLLLLEASPRRAEQTATQRLTQRTGKRWARAGKTEEVFDAGRVSLGALKKKLVPLDPEYIHELEVLRARLRQEDHQGDSGWGGAWTKERYRDLRDRERSGTV